MRLRVTTALFLCAVSAAGPAPTSAADRSDRPNIIYIMTDDLGYGDLGCYGQKQVKTPNLDRMAREGMRFTDHYAGHTVCRPSRLVLWLGQHVGHTGLTGNRDRSLTSTETTVASLLKKAGYATGGVGKWSLGNVNEPSEIDNPGHPNHNGFDYWFGYMNQGTAHNYYPLKLWENKTIVPLPGNVISQHPNSRGRVSSKRVSYSHNYLTNAAFKFIREHKEQPFLLHIHWTIPHANNEGGRVNGDGMEVPSYGQYADRDWPNPEKGFAAMVSLMDRDVGRLFELLKELELDESTVVFFTSDNGPHQEGGHKHEFFDSNGPLRGFKRSMHEGGIRVPMIARWPGRIPSGTTTAHPSSFPDFLPTACELAQVEAATDTDGLSYLPTLLGQHDSQQTHEYLYWASQEGGETVGVRMGPWKLVRYRKPKKPQRGEANTAFKEWHLYDLRSDISESDPVEDQHPKVAEQILTLLKRDNLLDTD